MTQAQDLADAVNRAAAFQELSLDLATARTTGDVCELIARHAARAMRAAGAAVWHLDGGGAGVLGAAVGLLEGVPLPVPDLGALPRAWLTEELKLALRASGAVQTRTAMLFAGGDAIGVLALVHDRPPDYDDPGLLGAIVRPAAEALGRALTTNEALRLAAIVAAADDAILSVARDLQILARNPAAERMYGDAAMLRPDPALLAVIERQGAGGGGERLEVRDGSDRIVALTIAPMRDEQGSLTALSITARDVTEQRAAESRVRRLAAIVEASPSAVIAVAPDGLVQEWSPGAEQLLGYTRDEVVGKPPPRLIADGAPPAARLRKDGATVLVTVTTFALTDADGQVTSVVTLMTDITESERLGAALRQAQRLEALGRLAGGVAHDFNNLLTVISGNAALVRADLGDRAAALDDVLGAAERAQAITRQLLTFARGRPVEPQRVPIRNTIAALLPVLRRLVGDSVSISYATSGPAMPIRIDRAQLEQVVMNLVVNAGHALPAGGVIRIGIESREGWVRLTVADSGVGMSEQTLAQLFEPFFTTRGEGSGTGLGLAIVHGTVTQAGGTIAVESAPGEGTVFTIDFPADPGPLEPEASGEQAAAPPRSATVLVCEDEPTLLRLVGHILSRAGYTVLTASTPSEALTLASDDVSLLITDIQLPELTGPELAQRLLAEHPSLRVLFMSGWSASAGVPLPGAVLEKPFTPVQLLTGVKALLEA